MPKYPHRGRPAHPPPLERFNQPVILMVTVALRIPHPYHCLDNAAFHRVLLSSWQQSPDWLPGLYVIMPDHLHFFCVRGAAGIVSVSRWCQKWKSLVTMTMDGVGWRWLAGCWDTQMRSADHYLEKKSYARMNPVRKGLVTRCEEWGYQGELRAIAW